MDRSVRFFVFTLLIVTTGARAVAQSHQKDAAARKEESHATPASTKELPHGGPASAKETPQATPSSAKETPHAAPAARKEAPLGAPAPRKEVPQAPAPAATARAVAAALADAQARRRQVRQPQRNRQVPLPVEKRWSLEWRAQEERVTLAWPDPPVYRLSWDARPQPQLLGADAGTVSADLRPAAKTKAVFGPR